MEKKFSGNKKILKTAIFIVCLFTMTGLAQEMAVPVNLQSVLFKKIFGFDKTLTSKGEFEVAVIGNSSDEIVSAFKQAGVNVKAVSGDQIPAGTAVAYIMPGVTSTKQQTASQGVLSISGVTSYAENGSVAIGLGIEGGKPKIIINMNQLKAEKQELSADLLKIAKIIQ